jgi:hypothetical protein
VSRQESRKFGSGSAGIHIFRIADSRESLTRSAFVRDLEQVPVVGDEEWFLYQIPGRCRLGMLISRIVVLMQFIRSDKPNARFRLYRLRPVNSGEG